MKVSRLILSAICCLLLGICFVGAATAQDAGSLIATELRTEYRVDPLGVDNPEPMLGWQLQRVRASERGQRQTAYQILAATSPELVYPGKADLWDTGKVPSDETIQVKYAGSPLVSGQRVYWSVRVWDNQDRPSPFSDVAWWEMGKLGADAWEAQWISDSRPQPQTREEQFDVNPAPLFRKAFEVSGKKIKRARVYVSGLGYYELYLNGDRVGDHVLDPGWTNYDKRVYYAVYDVTGQIASGENAVGVMLGNGWYNPLPLNMFRLNLRETLPIGVPKVLLQLEIEYDDGTTQRVVTDESWRAFDGPVLKNNIYIGEVYDARKEVPGWNEPGFDDSGWRNVLTAEAPQGELIAQDLPPIKVVRSFQAVSVTEREPGVWVFDMGQNFAGWVTLKVQGKAGDRVTMRYGEILHEDGRVNSLTSTTAQIKDWASLEARDWETLYANKHWTDGPYSPKTAWQADQYILKGEGVETYTPRFTWHGFRYVEVTGFPGRPTLESLTGHALRSSVDYAGAFTCSNDLLNRVQEITMRAQESNMFSVQSDCPHRERFGYGGDIVAASEMAMFNLDMARFYVKTVRDFADAVRPNGGFTEIAPHIGLDIEGLGGGSGPVGWGTAHPMLVWQLYQYYGNRSLLEEQYELVRRWVDLIASRAEGFILDNGISDHESLAPKNKALTGTAFFYYNVDLFTRMARVLGREDDVRKYEQLAQQIKDAFNRRFLDRETGRYDTGTQASQAFALYMGLVPEGMEQKVLDLLVDSIMVHNNGHLSTGIFGTKYMFDVLTKFGRADVAYRVASQRDFPGYGYMIDNGATTLWESWSYQPYVPSHNHPMFGSVSEWFYKGLAGIQPAPDAMGFDKIVIRPNVVGDLQTVSAKYQSVRGLIESEWKLDGNRLILEIEIPAGTETVVYVPSANPEDIKESGVVASEAPGVNFVSVDKGASVYSVGSGKYRFVIENFAR